jgi:hypothetical protein
MTPQGGNELLLIKGREGNGENHDILGYIASAGLRVFLSARSKIARLLTSAFSGTMS